MATLTASSTRLSLSGARSKVAWYLPYEVDAEQAEWSDRLIPRGTAPSTHIIKVSHKGEEDIALNELACSLMSADCGTDTAKVPELPEVPEAISIERYDGIRADEGNAVIRMHQEDLCQALGFAPFYKYQPSGVSANYPAMAAHPIGSASSNPLADKLELGKDLCSATQWGIPTRISRIFPCCTTENGRAAGSPRCTTSPVSPSPDTQPTCRSI